MKLENKIEKILKNIDQDDSQKLSLIAIISNKDYRNSVDIIVCYDGIMDFYPLSHKSTKKTDDILTEISEIIKTFLPNLTVICKSNIGIENYDLVHLYLINPKNYINDILNFKDRLIVYNDNFIYHILSKLKGPDQLCVYKQLRDTFKHAISFKIKTSDIIVTNMYQLLTKENKIAAMIENIDHI